MRRLVLILATLGLLGPASALAARPPHALPTPAKTNPAIRVKVEHEGRRVARFTDRYDDAIVSHALVRCYRNRHHPWRCLLRFGLSDGAHCDAMATIRRERVLNTHGRVIRIGRHWTTQRLNPLSPECAGA